MPPDLLDGHELAEKIDSTYEDVMSWARRGIIPCIKVKGRVYFNLSRVVDAIRTRRKERQAVSAA